MVAKRKLSLLPVGRRWPEGPDEGSVPDRERNKEYITKTTPTAFARKLRKNQTEEESILWRELRNRRFSGFRFRWQEIIGPYIADFVCIRNNLIIEADGSHHDVDADRQRDDYLRAQGFRVLRFSNFDIKRKLDFVLENIWIALRDMHFDPDATLPSSAPSGHLLPTGRRGMDGA